VTESGTVNIGFGFVALTPDIKSMIVGQPIYNNVEGELLSRLHQHRQVFMQSDSQRCSVNLTTSR